MAGLDRHTNFYAIAKSMPVVRRRTFGLVVLVPNLTSNVRVLELGSRKVLNCLQRCTVRVPPASCACNLQKQDTGYFCGFRIWPMWHGALQHTQINTSATLIQGGSRVFYTHFNYNHTRRINTRLEPGKTVTSGAF
jgi:hypothetical protein